MKRQKKEKEKKHAEQMLLHIIWQFMAAIKSREFTASPKISGNHVY